MMRIISTIHFFIAPISIVTEHFRALNIFIFKMLLCSWKEVGFVLQIKNAGKAKGGINKKH